MTSEKQPAAVKCVDEDDIHPPARKDQWVKPAITSFKAVTEARGISYRPLDGISNLT